MTAVEDWRPIPGFEGLYEASDQGRLRNIRTGRVLKPGPHRRGYAAYCLRRDGQNVYRTGHRCVTEAFWGIRSDDLQTNHKNGTKTDNRLDNLERVTAKENMRHARETGLRDRCGEARP